MQVLSPRCSGLDLHKKTVVACVMISHPNGKVEKSIRTFSTMTAQLLAMSDWLASLEVTHVAMESSGISWRPMYNVLEGRFQLILANAHHIKALPGRKTDVKDGEWMAERYASRLDPPQLHSAQSSAHGARPDALPQKPGLPTHPAGQPAATSVLETANIKLTSVASDVLGTSGGESGSKPSLGARAIPIGWLSWPASACAANCRTCKKPLSDG
jgi:transposase